MIRGRTLEEDIKYLHALIPLVEEIKENHLDYSTEHTYLARYTPEIIEYGEFGILIEYPESYERVNETEVPSRECVLEFLKIVNKHRKYKTDFSILTNYSGSLAENTELTKHLIRCLLDEDVDAEHSVDVFLSEIHDTPISIDVDLFIWGLQVDERGYDPIFGVIRRPLGSDFTKYYRVWGESDLEFPQCYRPISWDHWPYHSVIEWRICNVTKEPRHVEEVLEQAIGLLDELSLSIGVTTILAGYSARTDLTFEPHVPLWKSREHKLGTLFDWEGHIPRPRQLELKHILVHNVLTRTTFPRLQEKCQLVSRVKTALKMYRESSRKSKDVEGILFSTVGLESLYTSDEQELRYKMAVRVSGIMEITRNDRKEAYEKVLEAYKIRSKFVHGEIGDLDSNQWSEIRRALVEYLRISILVFLRLPISKNKEITKFHSMLDSMHVDDDAKKRIIEWVGWDNKNRYGS